MIYILRFDKIEEMDNFTVGIWICNMFFWFFYSVESNNISYTLKLSFRFHVHLQISCFSTA